MTQHSYRDTRKRQILVANYSGYILGDDAIFESLMRMMQSAWGSNVAFSALTALPSETSKNYAITDVDHVYEYMKTSMSRRRTARMLSRSDLLLVGGGDIVEGQVALVVLTILARILGIPVAYVGVGVLPPRTARRRRLLASSLRHVSLVATRDPESQTLLIDLGVPKDLVHTFPDLAVALPLVSDRSATELLEGEHIATARPYVAVNLRSPEQEQYGTNWGEPTYEVLAGVCRELIDKGAYNIVCVPFVTSNKQPAGGADSPADDEVLTHFAQLIDRPERTYVLRGTYQPSQVAGILGHADAVISMRLHCVILSSLYGVPTIALSYARKVRAFMAQVGLEHYCFEIDDIREGTVEAALASILSSAIQTKEHLDLWRTEAVAQLRILESMLRSLRREPNWWNRVRRALCYPLIHLVLLTVAMYGRVREG